MFRSFRTVSAVALGGLVLVSGIAGAQGGGARGRGGMPPGNPDQPGVAQNAQRGPMIPPRSPAEAFLRQRDRLQLTDDQAKRLEALSTSQRDALKPNRANFLRAQADLVDAEDHDNLDAERNALEKLSKLRIDQHISQRKAMMDARAVLTPEQRDRLPGLMARGMSGGRGGFGGMMQRRGAFGRGGAAFGRGRGFGPAQGPGGPGAGMRPMPRMRPPRPDSGTVRQ
jgi:P pilus assembly/Cpx signaling pathway, periplasmic inhibitor/zinc-resistance associated protein